VEHRTRSLLGANLRIKPLGLQRELLKMQRIRRKQRDHVISLSTKNAISLSIKNATVAMCPLFDVASEIAVAILRDWIDVYTLARLDSAVCEHGAREQFLAMTSASHFVHRYADLVTNKPCIKAIEWLAKRQVRVTNWNINSDLSPSLIADLVSGTGGPHVESLSLFGLHEGTTAVVVTLTSLKCLKISRMCISECRHWMCLSAMTGAAQNSLRNFEVKTCRTPYTIDFSRNNFPNMQSLTFGGMNDEPSSDSIAGLIAVSPNLVQFCLRFGGVHDTVLLALSNHAKRLRVLSMRHVVGFTDGALCSLARSCIYLQSLYLDSYDAISEDVLQTFAENCPHLRAVAVHSPCTGRAVHALVTHRGASLRYLSLENVQFEDNSALLAIAQHCKNLLQLELLTCTDSELEAHDLIQLLSSLPHLKELVIEDCDAVTDAVLSAIAKHLPKLEYLNLYDSTGYTSVGALALARSLTDITEFSVSPSCLETIFTSEVLSVWKQTAPQLGKCGDRSSNGTTSYFLRFQ
jgi:hypothetical protein